MFLFCIVFAMALCAFCAHLFICALWSPAGKGLTSWLSFVVSAVSLSLPIGILGQVWYLIVSIPDLCTRTYFVLCCKLQVALYGLIVVQLTILLAQFSNVVVWAYTHLSVTICHTGTSIFTIKSTYA